MAKQPTEPDNQAQSVSDTVSSNPHKRQNKTNKQTDKQSKQDSDKGQGDKDNQQNTQLNKANEPNEKGNTLIPSTASDSPIDEESARPREPLKTTLRRRLMKDGRWDTVEAERDSLMKTARASGKSKLEAQEHVYAELDRKYPPLPPALPVPPPVVALKTREKDDSVTGLGDIPDSWPDLPSNASLQAEVSWVQANRLRVYQGDTVVLSKSLSPAPSHAALGWLETSIRAYSKWCDIAARATSTQEDEAGQVRREKVSIEDMRELLAEMEPVCPHCGEPIC